MKSSIRLSSSAGNSPISRNVGTCRSGITRRCVSARGLMSRTATRPSVFATWSPSRTSLQKRQSSGSEDRLLRHGRAAHPHELADRCVDEPRRVVVAVATPRPVDEHDVLRADLPPPAREAGRLRSRALRSFLTAGETESRAAVTVPGLGEYGKTCTLVIPAVWTTASVRSNAASLSVGKPTIASVVRLKSASGSRRRRYVLE